jgi:hypothetical protein
LIGRFGSPGNAHKLFNFRLLSALLPVAFRPAGGEGLSNIETGPLSFSEDSFSSDSEGFVEAPGCAHRTAHGLAEKKLPQKLSAGVDEFRFLTGPRLREYNFVFV